MMFKCEKCGVCENSALCYYNMTRWDDNKPNLCSECDPEINKWHGCFPKKPYTEKNDN